MVIALALGILVITLGAPAFAVAPSIVVQAVSVNGSVVQVTVKNVSSAPMQSTVAVQAVVNDTPIWSLVPVMLNAGQSEVVSTDFAAPVSNVATVGITDDPTPM
jgi:hypothetical protein